MIAASNIPDLGRISVADMAVAFPQSLEILDKYNLDYYCGGKKLFVKVCETAGLNAESIWREIQIADGNYRSDGPIKIETWSTPFLIEFIVHHHQYIRHTRPQIMELLDKVCCAHRSDSPFLLEVRKLFNTLSGELLNHLSREEEIHFPAIRKMSEQNKYEFSNASPMNAIDSPVALMENDHEMAGQHIKSLRALTKNYTLPDHACPTLRGTYLMLHQFDKELMYHIHIENNILFPRVVHKQQNRSAVSG